MGSNPKNHTPEDSSMLGIVATPREMMVLKGLFKLSFACTYQKEPEKWTCEDLTARVLPSGCSPLVHILLGAWKMGVRKHE